MRALDCSARLPRASQSTMSSRPFTITSRSMCRWGAVHRLENPGKILLELIEVQTGSYFGEDDIIRIEDDYRRS
jgi:Mannose-6-phosphate isomerase